MKGCDVSHWQGSINWGKVKAAGIEFAIIKCTEDIYFFDSMFLQNKTQARKEGLLCGFYHFARGTDAVAEANYFVSKVGEINTGEFLVLDWEIEHADSVVWCLKFLNRVTERTGVKPMIYMSESRVKKFNWKSLIVADYGLWIAKYASSAIYISEVLQRNPTAGQWGFWALWQYSSKGKVDGIIGNVDMNYTKIDIDVLKKYGKKNECLHCLIHCPK